MFFMISNFYDCSLQLFTVAGGIDSAAKELEEERVILI
jgi:hypothetical protein